MLSTRDLTPRMQGAYQGDFAAMQQSLNTAVTNLDEALTQVVSAAEQVASASGQINSGSQSLAQGASEQASTLEEVSSSLQELASRPAVAVSGVSRVNGREADSSKTPEQVIPFHEDETDAFLQDF